MLFSYFGLSGVFGFLLSFFVLDDPCTLCCFYYIDFDGLIAACIMFSAIPSSSVFERKMFGGLLWCSFFSKCHNCSAWHRFMLNSNFSEGSKLSTRL